jgi:hypothetical protein
MSGPQGLCPLFRYPFEDGDPKGRDLRLQQSGSIGHTSADSAGLRVSRWATALGSLSRNLAVIPRGGFRRGPGAIGLDAGIPLGRVIIS